MTFIRIGTYNLENLDHATREGPSLEDRVPVLRAEIGKAVIGQPAVVEELLTAFVAGGHCLLEGLPGLGKTLLIRTLGQAAMGAVSPQDVVLLLGYTAPMVASLEAALGRLSEALGAGDGEPRGEAATQARCAVEREADVGQTLARDPEQQVHERGRGDRLP